MPCRSQSGFTLIELMVVVAIMGIAAAVALPRIRTKPVQDATARVGALLQEAHREAIDLGPVPNGITDLSGATPDAMVRVFLTPTEADGEYLDVPDGTTQGAWVLFDRVQFGSNMLDPNIFFIDPQADYGTGTAYAGAPASTNVPAGSLALSSTTVSGVKMDAATDTGGTTVELKYDGESAVGSFAGGATGATIFLTNNANDGTERYRLTLFPLTGIPITTPNW